MPHDKMWTCRIVLAQGTYFGDLLHHEACNLLFVPSNFEGAACEFHEEFSNFGVSTKLKLMTSDVPSGDVLLFYEIIDLVGEVAQQNM